MLLGYPGSGKTYFSERLAKEIGAVRINADALRVVAFGTIEAAKEFDKSTRLLNSIVFNALDYAAAQVLKSGNSILCDYQHNAKAGRDKTAKVAIDNAAIPVVVWVKTPKEIAIQRGSERDESLDQRKHPAEKMTHLVNKFAKAMEVPGDDENVVVIDGTLPFEKQYESFRRQLNSL